MKNVHLGGWVIQKIFFQSEHTITKKHLSNAKIHVVWKYKANLWFAVHLMQGSSSTDFQLSYDM